MNDKYVDYIRKVMPKHPASCRPFEYAYVYGAIKTYSNINNPKLLDVGSGLGIFTKFLNSISECWVVDNSPNAIKYQTAIGLKCKLCDATNMPFESETFDIVTAISAIEHFGLYNDGINEDVINADKLAVDEIKRVLKPGGLFIITVPFKKKFIIDRQRLPALPSRWYDQDSIDALLSGFGDIKNVTYGRWTATDYEYTDKGSHPHHIMVSLKK